MTEILLKDLIKRYHKSYINSSVNKNSFMLYISSLKKCIESLEDGISKKESEEYLKNINRDFIKTFFNKRSDISVNTYNRIDMSICKNDKVEVIMEFKTPYNKSEMLSRENVFFTKKAFLEAIKYYYDERLNGNYNIKNIIITDNINWFIFNPYQFNDKNIEKLCKDYKNKQTSFEINEHLYKEISKIIIKNNISFDYTYFSFENLKSTLAKLTNNEFDINDKNIKKLVNIYKFFHPDFLLREYNPKDSNNLNQKFYSELLYILGLEEIKEDNKKVIKYNKNKNSFIGEVLHKLENEKGIDKEDEKEEIAFELIITWLNRILFLKLFEGQLISFNDSKNYGFLTSPKIKNFDELNTLFFDILGKRYNEREMEYKESSKNIPYLNSSLFEISDMEKKYFTISSLRDDREIEIFKQSNLKKWDEYKNIKRENILKYLLDFLESYNFSAPSSDNILSDESKDIINSAVLGLIFEKLNGYKDGSFYTPGFITEYMAKESIERAVVDSFNKVLNISCSDIDEVKTILAMYIKKMILKNIIK
ncbi:MAG: hypothetical protein BWY78_00461 [Alphaproteobacteria bacterium ADurb.Bin438]|nr:MAG: hypothetical protein BWY78_00461 [Alphaproteobacteria bacterium ADurb.Bin438]